MVVQDHPFNRDPASLLAAFTTSFYDTYYRPLHRISFVLDAQRAGTELAPYHRTNALLHALGSALVFATLLCLGAPRGASAAAGLVFAVHPALVSDVAWIPGRDNVLLAIFLLVSLCAFARFLAAQGPARAALWLALHWLGFAAALFSKEAAVGFPAVALAFAWLGREPAPRARRLLAAAAGWVACLALFLALRARALPFARDAEAFGVDALLSSWPAAFALLGRLLLPLRLSAFANLDALSVASGVLAVAALLLFARRSDAARKRRLLFGAAWFAILLAPTLIQRTGLYDYGEYRLYWLAFGPLWMGVELLRGVDWRRPAALLALAALCVALAARNLAYQRAFDGPLRFWTELAERHPESGWSWFHLGRTHYQDGDLEAALAAYARAESVGFERADLYVDLSAARLDRGDWQAAARAAEHAVALEPGHVHALANLGAARLQLGAYAEAAEALDAALDPRGSVHFRYADPGAETAFRARIHELLGTARYALGERAQADAEWREAIRLDPTRQGAWLKRIEAALAAGRAAQARRLAAELREQGGQLPPGLRKRLARPGGRG